MMLTGPRQTGLSERQKSWLHQGIEKAGLTISPAALQAIELHLAMVQKWRSKINLISLSNEQELISHHALDSLVLLPLLEQSRRVLDIGTGAGFPGMLLAAARPDIEFCLLDSRQRRIEFLRMVNTQLGLKNVSLECARVEKFIDAVDSKDTLVQSEAKFDTLIARAVASLSQLVTLSAPLRNPGQRLIAMKGLYPEQELALLKTQCADQFASVQIKSLEVPFLQAQRHAVIVRF